MLREHAQEFIKLTAASSSADVIDSLKENDSADYSPASLSNTIQTPLVINISDAEDRTLLESTVSDQTSYSQLTESAKYDEKIAYSKPLQPISSNITSTMQSTNPIVPAPINQSSTLSYNNQSASHSSSSSSSSSTSSSSSSSSILTISASLNISSSSSNGISSSNSSGTSSSEEDAPCIASINSDSTVAVTYPSRPRFQILQQPLSVQDYVDTKYFSNYLMMPKFYNRNVDMQYANSNSTTLAFNQSILTNTWPTTNTNQIYETVVSQPNQHYQQNQSNFQSYQNYRYNPHLQPAQPAANSQQSNSFGLNYETGTHLSQTPAVVYSGSNSQPHYQQIANNNENIYINSPNISNKITNVAY
jgi:hypothetical protein